MKYERIIKLNGVTSIVRMTDIETVTNRICKNADFILIDDSVVTLFSSCLKQCPHLIVCGGERAKSREVFDKILAEFFTAQLLRTSVVAIIGGGALCDVGAFAASVYMRGIKCELFPSTLLAMIDAAIGGKTAINYGSLKNMVGSFYPATHVFIAPEFLNTLPYQYIRHGLAEIIKAGMLQNPKIVNMIEIHAQEIKKLQSLQTKKWWQKLLWYAASVKLDIVERDFIETGQRAFLNLGHTFAHAVEAEAKIINQPWGHGDAVALGIRTALMLGIALGYTDSSYCKHICSLLDIFEYPSTYEAFLTSALISHIKNDKKAKQDGIYCVLQKNMCETKLQLVSVAAITDILRKLGAK